MLRFCILLIHGAETSSRAGKTNQYPPTNPPAFPPTFLATASLSLTSLPSSDGHSCSGMVVEASVGVCMAWGKGQVLTGRGPALLSSCFAAQGRETKLHRTWQGMGPAPGCESQHWDAWIPLLPGVPQGHSTLTVSSCPCSQQPGESRDRH